MAKSAAGTKREKWTLSFDAELKEFVVEAAKRRGIYPSSLLESLVREKFSPYGHADIDDSQAYVRMLRRRSRNRSDADFLREIRRWQRSASS
jgi:hypothetical protein